VARTREYELVVVVSPAVDDAGAASTIERIHNLITSGGGTLTKHEPWGMRRLAYPIRDFTEGNYFLTQFSADPSSTQGIESALRLSENVLRHLLVKVEE
jgi:small subunit ribosomal protein S6